MSDFMAKMYQIQFKTKTSRTTRLKWNTSTNSRLSMYLGWGSAPDPAGSAYSATPGPLDGLRGPTSKGRGEEGREGGRGGDGKGRGSGGDETPPLHAPLIHISGYAPVVCYLCIGLVSVICTVSHTTFVLLSGFLC